MDVMKAMVKQKHGKSPGPGGIHMEAFTYGGHRLNLNLSILFNLFLIYGYVPDAFNQTIIIPLIKCKPGDVLCLDNYLRQYNYRM